MLNHFDLSENEEKRMQTGQEILLPCWPAALSSPPPEATPSPCSCAGTTGQNEKQVRAGSKHKQASPPATARSKSSGAPVSTHQVVQRAAASSKHLGARAHVVDERVDEATLTAARGGEFCKIALHVYGNQQHVVRALSWRRHDPGHTCAESSRLL